MSIASSYKIPVNLSDVKFFKIENFQLESGDQLNDAIIAYHTFGKLNEDSSNVVWVCHALTANSDVSDWWSGLFGEHKTLDPTKDFIVCANLLGSCYGSTGPRSINPATGIPYGLDFPSLTIRDWTKAHYQLATHLNIKKIKLAIGGSCGGHQVLEMCLNKNLIIEKAALLVCSAKETAWSIAIHQAQRLALKADPSFNENSDSSGILGLKAARGMALLNYRSFSQYISSQSDTDFRINDFRASSYVDYQGQKLIKRFYAHCYYNMLNTLDTHNVGRGRGSIEKALQSISSKTCIISIDTDMLIPTQEQEYLHKNIPNSQLHILRSDYGHDGFLTEAVKINEILSSFK